MGQLKLLEEARHPLVDHGDAITTGRLSQGAAKPGFTDSTGPVLLGDVKYRMSGSGRSRKWISWLKSW
jgi:hypothetical protein